MKMNLYNVGFLEKEFDLKNQIKKSNSNSIYKGGLGEFQTLLKIVVWIVETNIVVLQTTNA